MLSASDEMPEALLGIDRVAHIIEKRTLGSVRSEIQRLRQTFRAELRTALGQPVSAPPEIEAELLHLRAVLIDQDMECEPTVAT